MEDDAIDARAEGPVSLVLHRGWMLQPMVRLLCGERLRCHDASAVGVRDRRGFNHAPVGIDVSESRPELRHGNVGHGSQFKVRAGIQVVRFESQLQSVAVTEVAKTCRLVLNHQLLRCLPDIPKEAFRRLLVIDHVSPERGKKWRRTVSSSLLKLRLELGRPVLRAHFPTVIVERGQSAVRVAVGSNSLQQLCEVSVEVMIDRLAAELV
jgi:hypothetical protein